ncbi:MAG: Sewage-associated circular virus6 [Bacteroidota bacterium]|jgi:hypothetical protein
MPNYPKAKYWLLTIPHNEFLPYLPNGVLYLRGQLERGATTGYLHWQLLAIFSAQQRLATVKRTFGDAGHYEPSRSDAADAYVWKEETRVAGTQFELGKKPFRRDQSVDWDRVRDASKSGEFDAIPSDIFVRNYSAIRRISSDYAAPVAMERSVIVLWGPTGVGKSRRAWEEAGLDAYPKCPLSKFWDGYRGQQSVVIDEFRGTVSISHVLRWFDRYPVLVEIKGSSTVLKATRFWITSNLHPRDWYPDLDDLTKEALLRRLNIIHCPINLY